jgi:putative nucleotidyltransferase with HDIG domain
MKPFQTLTRQIAQWRKFSTSQQSVQRPLNLFARRTAIQVKRCRRLARIHFKSAAVSSVLPSSTKRRKARSKVRGQPSVFFVLAVLSLTSAIGYRLYNEPELGVGTVAPQTLRAPASARVIDTKTTESNRKAARTAAIPVLMIDQTTNEEVNQSLQRLLDRGNRVRQQSGSFPFVDTAVLSTQTQQYVRQIEEWEWRMMLFTIENNATPAPAPTEIAPSTNPLTNSGKAAISSSTAHQVSVSELQAYRRSSSAEDFAALKEAVNQARQRYATAIALLIADATSEQDQFYDPSLLSLTDGEWTRTQSAVRLILERILTQGVPPGLPDALLKTAIETQVRSEAPATATALSTRLLMAVIQPNLVQDPEQTKARAEQAAQSVEDVVVEIRQSEIIVRSGEIITQSDFVLLDYFGLSRRRINWSGLLGFGALVSGSVVVFLLVEQKFHPGLRRRDHLLLLLLTLGVSLVVALDTPAIGLSALGLLAGSFYGSALGVTVVAILSFLLPVGLEVTWTNLVASSLGGIVGAAMAGRLRSREELAMLGIGVGLTQGLVYLILNLMLSPATFPVWYVVLKGAGLQALLGLAWSIVALGISPYLENLFDLVTSIRLAELSNPNRPLLKRLASEAPGTFQHTLFVATLAEAAARALGCNVELVRAGTLYHDIGKMHDPLGFIENQMGGPNKHDTIDNPWVSAAIIKKHVTEGIFMARKCRLPKAIQSFIPEHQGTMLISYFYHQAQQRAKDQPYLEVNEADFRYDGPIPQSRETGIVMLADSCEAALRSLKDATPDEALAMVNRILRARWQDNQLVDSGLTRAEMTRIAEIFVKVWQQFNHQRIPYPKAVFSSQPSNTNSL